MKSALMQLPLVAIWRKEFSGYTLQTFQRDLLAGITVGTVALPLALAFGVASGADAAAGLITAILAGIIIGLLGGGAFQISGPTGAMSAILIILAQRYGLPGIWTASILAGIFLILLGVFRLGRYVSFIPTPVITGFTSGIALIIAIGQIDNILGVQTAPSENALEKLWLVLSHTPTPNMYALAIAGIVVLTMVIQPRVFPKLPGSLLGLILATVLAAALHWSIPTIGAIPRTILLDNRLTWATIPWENLTTLIPSAVAIAALGAIESLLCGTVGATMTGNTFDSNQELVAQGIGNMIIPFFGGVPATAAIARSSVGIKSGGATRIMSVVHALVLILSVFLLSPLISQIPLAALGGVLLVTAWRMNEWESIHFFTRRGVRHALSTMLFTMLATIALDLTQAILIGIVVSALIYLRQSTESVSITSAPVDRSRLQKTTTGLSNAHGAIHVYYLSGPLFFGSIQAVVHAFEQATTHQAIIISMRGVPLIDVSGVQTLMQIIEQQQHRGGVVCLSGLQPHVENVLTKSGALDTIGRHHIFWSTDQAIVALDQHSRDTHTSMTLFPPHMTVADVMTQEVYTVRPTTPISEIVSLLIDQSLSWLPVVDDQQRVLGVITEGDLLRRGIISLSVDIKQLLPLQERAASVIALDAQQQTASDVLSPNPQVAYPTMSLAEAAELMVQHTIKRLPVVDSDHRLVGVLARSDVLATIAETPDQTEIVPYPSLATPRCQVGDIMRRDIPVVQTTTPLAEVLQTLVASVQHRVVVLEDQRVVGLITDGDILKRSARHLRPGAMRRFMQWLKGGEFSGDLAVALQGTVAADVMTTPTVTVAHTVSIVAALQKLMVEDVVGMPVVDEQEGFLGWLDRSQLLHAFVAQRRQESSA